MSLTNLITEHINTTLPNPQNGHQQWPKNINKLKLIRRVQESRHQKNRQRSRIFLTQITASISKPTVQNNELWVVKLQ